MRRRMTFTEEVAGVECELTFDPIDDTLCTALVGDKRVAAYLVYDEQCDRDDLMGDCMGELYSFHRHSRNHAEGLAALGNDKGGERDLDTVWSKHEDVATARYVMKVLEDYTLDEIIEHFDEYPAEHPEAEAAARDLLINDCSGICGWAYVMFEKEMQSVLEDMWEDPRYFPGDKDAQLLACYDHGSQHWSLSGDGMQCRWDTSNQAGVWVPDKYLREVLDADEKKGLNRNDQARKYCKQFLEVYNHINNGGEVYGCVVEWFDENGKQIDSESCWGFVGSDHATESLKSEFFDPTCERLRAEYEEDVRTQCGRQMEIPS